MYKNDMLCEPINANNPKGNSINSNKNRGCNTNVYRKKVERNYLLFNFNSCFYCVFKIGYFDSVCFTFFKLVDDFFV